MTASRRRTDNVPAKKRYRETSPKTKKKLELQQFVHDLAKSIFSRSLRFVDAKVRHRKKELYYKIKITGLEILSKLASFSNAIKEKTEDNFKLSFSGSINPKTGKEDLFLYLVIFNKEGNYESTTPIASERCKAQRIPSFYGEEEVGFDSVYFAG